MKKISTSGRFDDIGFYFAIHFPEDKPVLKEIFETYLIQDDDNQIQGGEHNLWH